MSTRIQMISVAFNVQLNQFKAGLDEAAKRTKDFQQKSEESFKKLKEFAWEAGKQVVGSFKELVTDSAKAGFSLIQLKDNALLAFKAFTGSTATAQKHLADLQAFAARTPFELPGLIQSSMKLQNAGLAAEKVVPALTSVGDAVAAVGGSSDSIDRVTTQLSQMLNNAKFSTEEMKTMAEAGIPAWQSLAQVMGVSVPEAQKRVTDGAVSTSKYFDAFIAEIGRKTQGAMAAQSNSLTGLLSTLSDNFADASAKIWEPLYRGATEFLQWAMGPSGLKFDGVVKSLSASVAGLSRDLFGFLQENGQAILDRVGQAFVIFAEAVRNTVAAIRQMSPVLGPVLGLLADLALAIGKVAAAHPILTGAILGAIRLWSTGIPQAIGLSKNSLMRLGEQLVSLGRGWVNAFKPQMAAFIQRLTAKVLELATKMGLLKQATAALNGLSSAGSWLGTLAGKFGKLGGAIRGVVSSAGALTTAASVAGAAWVGFKIGTYLRQFVYGKDYIEEFNQAMEKSAELQSKMMEIRQRELNHDLEDVAMLPTAERKAAAEQKQQEAIDGVAAAEAWLTSANQAAESTLWEDLVGDKLAEVRKNAAKEAAEDLEFAKSKLQAWNEALGDARRQLERETRQAAEPPEAVEETPKDAPDPKAIAKQIADAQAQALERDNPLLKGLSELKEFASSGGTILDVEAFARTIEGMTPEMAAALREGLLHAAETGFDVDEVFKTAIEGANRNVESAKRAKSSADDSGQILDKAAKDLPREQVAAFGKELDALRQKFVALGLTEEEYAQRLDEIREKVAAAAETAKILRDAEAELDKLRAGKPLAPALESKNEELRLGLQSGDVTPDAFQAGQKDIQERVETSREAQKSFGTLTENGVDPAFSKQYQALQAQLETFKISAEQFQTSFGQLEEKIRASQQATETFQRVMDGAFGQTFGEKSEEARKFQKEMNRLKNGLASGKVGLEEFSKEVKKLEEQAEKAAAAEKQNRLIRGDFRGAGLDPEQALKDELASRQQSKFQEMISQYADRLTGAGDKAKQFGDNVKSAGDAAQDFASTLPSQQEAASAWEKISNFIASIDGQRALILNNIALMRQSLQITEDALSRQDLQRKIDDLIRQLQVLDQQQANLPTFIADRGDLEFKDPGLSGGGSGGSSRGSVHITLPNVNKFGQAEAELIVNTIEREMTRRGRRL